MKRQVKRLVKGLESSAPVEFPAAEVSALLIWGLVFSICYGKFHSIITIAFSTVIAVTIFILFRRYIKLDKLKQKEIDIDIINIFNLAQKDAVEISISSSHNFDIELLKYAVKTLINLQLIKFFAELTEDGKVIVTAEDGKRNIISKHTYYNLMDFSKDFEPKEIA